MTMIATSSLGSTSVAKLMSTSTMKNAIILNQIENITKLQKENVINRDDTCNLRGHILEKVQSYVGTFRIDATFSD